MNIIKLTARALSRISTPATGQIEIRIEGHRGLSLLIGQTSRSWILRSEYRGKRQVVKLADHVPGEDLREVGDAADEQLRQMRAGIDLAAQRRNEKGMTFKVLVEEFLKRHPKKKSTLEEYRRLLEHDVTPVWGALKAVAITKRDVNDLLDSISDSGRRISANRAHAVVSAVFKYALGRDIVSANPVKSIPKPAGKEPGRDRRLSDDELRTLGDVLTTMPTEIADAYVLLILTGARLSEVLGLVWSEIDLERAIWTLPALRSKNGKEHQLPLVGRALATLQRRRGADSTGTCVFPSRTLHKMIEPKPMTLGRSRREITRLCAFNTGWQVRDLRRTCATRLDAIAGRFVAGMVLGHADASVTSTYAKHDYQREMRNALSAWDREFTSIIEPSVERSNVIALRA
jgi:integrase